MSDFTSVFWDYFIAVITVVSVIGCGVFLWSQSKRRVKVGAGTEPDTTGHVWDGDLQEFHNPLPRWWMWLFYITVVFSVVYLILYPGLGSQFKGILNWTSGGQHQAEVKAAQDRYGPLFASYLKMDVAAVAADERGRQMGARIFQNNCAQCHGSDGRGSRGFPNLTDGEWQWGGAPEAIKTTIVEGRKAAMPPMAAAVGGAADVEDVAHYVLSLSGSAHDSVRAARGRDKFAACAACHGADGKGNPALGSVDLTNKTWLYGGTVATISETITKGRSGVMPAWKGLLSEAEIHLVAAYVYGLANPGQSASSSAKK
ncbi:MAG: cytochrome-c oxidase, cbb3-type subunit III [Burkholderiales bacterium]|nr:MAG: cytochrome-c oxidase, cbb3-type subunit III [Burkholderiales bacterium]